MTARELQIRLQAAQPPTLLHVLPPEVFAATRIPGSLNACVYEMTFLDQVRALASDASAPIVVYGAGEGVISTLSGLMIRLRDDPGSLVPSDPGLIDGIPLGFGNAREPQFRNHHPSAPNPNGIESISPGLTRSGYAGNPATRTHQP